MSYIFSAIDDDTKEYKAICKLYGETPVKDEYGVDPYCKHATDLRKKHYKNLEKKENEKIVNHTDDCLL